MPLKVRDVIRLLTRNGWKKDRQKGSHRQFVHPSNPHTITVAGKEGTDMPPGTAHDILKKAGVK
jgi:predicted RNA binding protein YcfA (HicA-like mRNA interferase family)